MNRVRARRGPRGGLLPIVNPPSQLVGTDDPTGINDHAGIDVPLARIVKVPPPRIDDGPAAVTVKDGPPGTTVAVTMATSNGNSIVPAIAGATSAPSTTHILSSCYFL